MQGYFCASSAPALNETLWAKSKGRLNPDTPHRMMSVTVLGIQQIGQIHSEELPTVQKTFLVEFDCNSLTA